MSAATALLLSWRLKALVSMGLVSRAWHIFVLDMSGWASKYAMIPTLPLSSSLDAISLKMLPGLDLYNRCTSPINLAN